MAGTWRLDAHERNDLAENGFVLRKSVFDANETRAICTACESLVERVLAEKRHTKRTAGSYMFELQRKLEMVVKWEPDSADLVQGLEPFAHVSDELHRWALDARIVEPCKDVVGDEDVALFTEKLNLKRAHKGGPIVLHQDFPYWSGLTQIASRVATAMIFLDATTLENGCLEVVPGSHREGLQSRRAIEGIGGLEMDPKQYDESRLTPLPVPGGSAAFFGPFLVHRSRPNRTGADRRALLYSYQPVGHPHLRELTRLAARPPAN